MVMLMRGLVASLCLASGCADIFDLTTVTDGGIVSDGAELCRFGPFGRNGTGGAGLFDVCFAEQPPPMFVAPSTIDTGNTDQCTRVIDQGPTAMQAVCVIVAEEMMFSTTTRVTGPLPLVLVATRDLSITGTLDVGSTLAGGAGAGLGHVTCENAIGGQVGSAIEGGGGGAGGSLQTTGAQGGDGDGGDTVGGTPVLAATTATFVRGGCAGGAGGHGASLAGGEGGAGGGSVYLIAGSSIQLSSSALINASGAGGAGGARGVATNDEAGGGGGGGSGGMIGLDAPRIVLASSARLAANGGGGGSGGTSAVDGPSGESAATSAYPFPAAGGGSAPLGGAGADQTSVAQPGLDGGARDGGGGGGGGTGFIVMFGAVEDAGARVSPMY